MDQPTSRPTNSAMNSLRNPAVAKQETNHATDYPAKNETKK
jgi:hypothetical protein